MRVLAINAFSSDAPGRALAEEAVAVLIGAGHDVRRSDLLDDGFNPFMSAAERLSYHDDQPIVNDDVAREANAVRWSEALLFCYPTTSFTVPAVLKGWMDRVFVPGVAFGFDSKGRVTPGLTNVRHLGVVNTTPADRWQTLRMRDGGRRTIARTIRLNCNKRCRLTWVAVRDDPAHLSQGAATVRRRLARW